MPTLPISVIIPTKNEEGNLETALKSVSLCDQVLVIDSGSMDRTIEIARTHGAEIYPFNYQGGWPKKRQWAMDSLDIRNPWTLLLDADESVPDDLRKELESIVAAGDSADGYWIRLRMYFLGRILRHGASGLEKMSFFRTGKGRFEQRLAQQDTSMADMEVHEHVVITGSTNRCSASLVHNNVLSLDRYIQKHNEYSNWEAQMMHEARIGGGISGGIPGSLATGSQAARRRWLRNRLFFVPGFSIITFLYFYIFRLGFLDGRPGLIYCAFKGIQRFHVKCKMYELVNRRSENTE